MKKSVVNFDGENTFSAPKTPRIPGVRELIETGAFSKLEKHFLTIEEEQEKKRKPLFSTLFRPLKGLLGALNPFNWLPSLAWLLLLGLKLAYKLLKGLFKLLKKIFEKLRDFLRRLKLRKARKKVPQFNTQKHLLPNLQKLYIPQTLPLVPRWLLFPTLAIATVAVVEPFLFRRPLLEVPTPAPKNPFLPPLPLPSPKLPSPNPVGNLQDYLNNLFALLGYAPNSFFELLIEGIAQGAAAAAFETTLQGDPCLSLPKNKEVCLRQMREAIMTELKIKINLSSFETSWWTIMRSIERKQHPLFILAEMVPLVETLERTFTNIENPTSPIYQGIALGITRYIEERNRLTEVAASVAQWQGELSFWERLQITFSPSSSKLADPEIVRDLMNYNPHFLEKLIEVQASNDEEVKKVINWTIAILSLLPLAKGIGAAKLALVGARATNITRGLAGFLKISARQIGKGLLPIPL